MAEVYERALYRHFKSTPEDPRYYVTLKREIAEDGHVYVWYTPQYDFGVIVPPRSEQEFLETIHREGTSIGRFVLMQKAVITIDEVNRLLRNHAEDN